MFIFCSRDARIQEPVRKNLKVGGISALQHCRSARAMFGSPLPYAAEGRFCPECMDRLPFASEVVLSEVADMYPAC